MSSVDEPGSAAAPAQQEGGGKGSAGNSEAPAPAPKGAKGAKGAFIERRLRVVRLELGLGDFGDGRFRVRRVVGRGRREEAVANIATTL